MTEIKGFNYEVTHNQVTVAVDIEFKHNHATWEAEITVIRTEQQNLGYSEDEHTLVNEDELPELTPTEKQELFDAASEYVTEKLTNG